MLDLGVMNEKNKGVLTSLLGYFGYMPGEKANVGEGELKAFAEAWKYSYLRDVNPPNKVTVRAPDFTQSPPIEKIYKKFGHRMRRCRRRAGSSGNFQRETWPCRNCKRCIDRSV